MVKFHSLKNKHKLHENNIEHEITANSLIYRYMYIFTVCDAPDELELDLELVFLVFAFWPPAGPGIGWAGIFPN